MSKRIIFLGSSVTFGSASGGVSFADIICEKNGYEMIKEAVSGTTLVDSDDKPIFVYTLPSAKGDVMILSSPEIETGTTYILKTGVSVSGGIRFHNLYTTLPSVSGGTSTITNFATSSSNTVYTDSSVSSGFGGRP